MTMSTKNSINRNQVLNGEAGEVTEAIVAEKASRQGEGPSASYVPSLELKEDL